MKQSAGVENTTLTVLYADKNYHTGVRGVENDYLVVQDWQIEKGRIFEKSELRSGQSVCIIGKTVAKKLFDKNINAHRKKDTSRTFFL